MAFMERVLVVLPNWYGETLFATPFLRALRSAQPSAFLAAVGWPRCREVLLHNPCVDELIDYDERGADRGLRGAARLLRALRARHVDAAFVLRPSLSRTALLALAGIPQRVGFANDKSGWLLTHRAPAPSGREHKAASYLRLLTAVGVEATPHPYEYVVSPEEERAARRLLAQHHLANGRPWIALHPGANWPHKQWPAERLAAVGDRLASSHRVQIVLTGGPADAPLVDAVRRQMRSGAVVLAGETTFRQLGACLQHAQLVVTHDTGALHLAAALGRPVVALYGPTSPALTGPLGDPRCTVVLHHPGCCPRIPCYQPHHPSHPGMAAITVDEVYDAAAQLLGGERWKVKGGRGKEP